MYRNLGLTEWPFEIVPTPERMQHWAGRPKVRDQILRAINRWKRRPSSEINTFWAVWGQGKTHTLGFIKNKAEADERTLVHYLQLPALSGSGSSPFVTMYRQILQDFPLEQLGKLVFENFKNNPRGMFATQPGPSSHLYQLLWLIGTKSQGSDLAKLWLKAENVSKADLAPLRIADRKLSIPSRPRNAQDCLNTLSGLFDIAINLPTQSSGQVILLIDEFQRIGELPNRQRREICDSLHLIFNTHPNGLRLVLTFAMGLSSAVDAMLTDDLRSRVRSRMDLEPLVQDAALEYIGDLLNSYRLEESAGGDFSPFGKAGAREVVAFIFKQIDTCTPRILNVVFDEVLNTILESKDDVGEELDSVTISIDEVKEAIEISGEQIHLLLAQAGE